MSSPSNIACIVIRVVAFLLPLAGFLNDERLP